MKLKFTESRSVKMCAGLAIAGWLIATQSAGAATAIKARIVNDGLYSVSASSLATSFGTTETQVVAWLQSKQIAVENFGRLAAAAYTPSNISFFAQGYSTRFTGENIYWIKQAPGLALTTVSSTPASVVTGRSFPASYHAELNSNLVAELIRDVKIDPWIWTQLIPNSSFTKTQATKFELPGVVSGVSIVVRLQGFDKTTPGASNNVSISVSNSFGNVVLGTVPVVGPSYVVWTGSLSSVSLATGLSNTLRITANVSSGQRVYVDNYTIAYNRGYAAVSNELLFGAAGNDPVTVTGFASNDIEVYDVSDAWLPRKVTGLTIGGAAGNYNVSFHPATSTGRYVAVSGGLRRAPVALVADVPSTLRSQANGIDYVAITVPSLKASAQTLVNYRASHGIGAMVVDLQDIFDEFNFGIADPRAVKAFVGYSYYTWAKAPRYVCLVGEGSMDYRNYKGGGDCLVPSVPHETQFSQLISDSCLGDVNDDGANEVAIGRLPVMTSNDFLRVFSKIQVYENGGSWKSTGVSLADTTDQAGNFSLESDLLISQMPGMTMDRVYAATQSLASAHSNVLAKLNAGRGIFTYVGQAGAQMLGKVPTTNLLSEADVTNLLSSAKPAFMIGATCLAGNFGGAGADCLGEQYVRATNGFSGMYGSGDQVFAGDSRVLTVSLVSNLFTDGTARIGDAIIHATQKAAVNGSTVVTKAYNLIGDPALAVGGINSTRPGALYPTDLPAYDNWVEFIVAPVLADAGVGMNPEADDDGDGVKNADECAAGTDPLDMNSHIAIVECVRQPGKVAVKWSSSQHRMYDLERCTNMVSGQYQAVGVNLSALPPFNVHTDNVSSASTYFYRVRVK